MGTIYLIACKDCKITRDLDKFYTAKSIKDREDAINYTNEIKEDSFRSGLLISFMSEHKGHNCVFFDEHDNCSEQLDPSFNEEYKEDIDFW